MEELYLIVERNIGRAGTKKKAEIKQKEWNNKYGEGNWQTGYEFDGKFLTREQAIEEIYDRSYFKFLDEHHEIVNELVNSGGVFNPHALLSNSVDIQAKTVERYIKARGLKFKGKELLPIGSYQPKWNKEEVFKKAINLGLKIVNDKIKYPQIAYTLSPFSIHCIANMSISIEEFWQSNSKCLAIKKER